MSAVDAAFVLVPRFSTIVGPGIFTSLPVDVASYGGAQIQVWRGPIREKPPSTSGTFQVRLEESLDLYTWVLGPSIGSEITIGPGEVKFLSYSFRLRWFRVALLLTGSDPIVTCWVEGLLRGGGSGVWGLPAPEAPATAGQAHAPFGAGPSGEIVPVTPPAFFEGRGVQGPEAVEQAITQQALESITNRPQVK